MSMFVFPLIAFALTGSMLAAAAAEALHLLGLVGALLPAGGARRPARPRAADAGQQRDRPLLYGTLAAAGATGTLPRTLLLRRAVTGVAAGVFLPAETAAVRAVVTPRSCRPR